MKMQVTVNGKEKEVKNGLTVKGLLRVELDELGNHVAVAVDGDVLPRDQWERQLEGGQEVEIVQPIQGGTGDNLEIAGETFGSRLFVGTGGHTNLKKLKQSIEVSETEMVTVGLRRVNSGAGGDLMSLLERLEVRVLPNTAGCYTAEEAVITAKMGREALDTNWVKLEVIGDDETMFPDTTELVEAARELVGLGFVVLPYTSDDPITAKKLVEVGCPAVMPLGSPIGSGRGLSNPDNLRIIREAIDVPMIVDAGIGSASDAAEAMELGADAILVSSAIARAEQPPLMAAALRDAVRAGRQSYLAGRIPEKLYAKPTTVMEGRIRR